MTGLSWHRGCPVGRAGLRLLRINYWDYGGYRRRGELVANADAAGQMAAALAEMYRRKLPIRAMYRVDRFGWGARSRGGDDYGSMAAGNTSAFNCRDVVGRPRRPLAALLRPLARPQHLGEPLPLARRAPSPTPGGRGTRTPASRGARGRTRWSQADGPARAPLDLRQRRHPALRRRGGHGRCARLDAELRSRASASAAAQRRATPSPASLPRMIAFLVAGLILGVLARALRSGPDDAALALDAPGRRGRRRARRESA